MDMSYECEPSKRKRRNSLSSIPSARESATIASADAAAAAGIPTTRSLDIVCKDRLEFDIWTIGLQVRQLAFFIQIAFFLKEVFHGNNRTCCSVMDFKNKIVHAWTEKVVRMRYVESRKHYGRKVIDRRKSCRTINICRKVSVKYFCR